VARVFIGIPTLNRPAMVVDAIESVRRQTFPDCRVIVSDNHSDGNAGEIVRNYVESLDDPRFAFHEQPENIGEYGQGRFFLQEAEDHEFFMILHDDDVLDPGYIEAAISALDTHPSAAFFVANYYCIDETGKRWPEQTMRYLRHLGRTQASEGLIDVLSSHVMHGFTPISGTLFRKRSLDESGYVDPDCYGNYPFEANVFLRLGETGAKAWFSTSSLLGIRFHRGSLRSGNYMVGSARTCLRMWGRRRFTGSLERRRKMIMGRFYRADALNRMRTGDLTGARASLFAAMRENPCSVRLWGVMPLALIAPGILRTLASRTAAPNASKFS
jgi:glycosyltransferase involved in cell wall biosynthesis